MKNYEKILFKDRELELEVLLSLEERTAYLSQAQIALLYEKSVSFISKTINKIYSKEQLETLTSVENFDISTSTYFGKTEKSNQAFLNNWKISNHRPTKLYCLEVVLEIGSYFRSKRGQLLKEFVDDYLAKQFKKDNEIIIYNNNGVNLSVTISPKQDTVWLSVDQMAILFDRDRSVILKHINNIYEEDELDGATCAKNAQVQIEGGRQVRRETDIYNLDVIISVGYRVKSRNGVIFRKWATSVLKQYLLKGYVISPERALVTKENYEELVLDVHNLKKDVNEIKEVLGEKVINPYICYEGQYYDGFVFINDLIRSAKENVVIVDGYADDTVFKFFKGSNKGIEKTIICHKVDRITQEPLDTFIKQYGTISILENKAFHDRFLVVDDDVYMIGSSLNSIGHKTTVVIKVQDFTIDDLLQTKTQP